MSSTGLRCISTFRTIQTGTASELYRDRPKEEWPRNRYGTLGMFTRPLDVRALLAEAE
jgi:catechol 2,3-dioxygenase